MADFYGKETSKNLRKLRQMAPDMMKGFIDFDQQQFFAGFRREMRVGLLQEKAFAVDSFDVSTAPRTPELKTRDEVLASFDKTTAVARKAIADSTDAHFMQPWTLKAGPNTIFTLPRVAVVRSFLLNHNIHHRAQLGVYLRLNDIPVPSIYGPSGDDPMMLSASHRRMQ